jgi:uncharacterized membrane protein
MRVNRNAIPRVAITAGYMVASLIIGLTLPRSEIIYGSLISNDLSHTSAQAFLASISSGMMTLAAIIFSVAFIVAQYSATAYTPRLQVELSRSTLQFHALGLFIATFTLSLSTLLWIDRAGSQRVPSISLIIVTVLSVLSLIALAFMVRDFQQLNISFVLRNIGMKGRRALAHDLASRAGTILTATPETVDALQTTALVTHDGEPMTIADYDFASLLAQARAHHAIIVLENAVGDVLVDGWPVLSVRGGTISAPETLKRYISVASARTFANDPEFALRLFVDIAIRALSPAVNDPTTAVQSLDQIEDYLVRIGTGPIPTGYVGDDDGTLRVVYPAPAWGDFLNLAFNEIRYYGRSSVQVQRRLRAAMEGLAYIIRDPARRDAVLAYQKRLDLALDPSFDAVDIALARHPDRHGLGSGASPP